MHNIVDLSAGRARSRRSSSVSQDGARILLFTGVRYVREPDVDVPAFVPDAMPFCEAEGELQRHLAGDSPSIGSAACFDLATH